MLGGRNLRVKPLHMGQRSWVTPCPEGNLPAQAPLSFVLGSRHKPCVKSRIWGSHRQKHPKTSLPWGSCTPVLHCLMLHPFPSKTLVLGGATEPAAPCSAVFGSS